jgi:hypothetical protein
MTTSVADRSSNKNEQIVHAAEVIGRSAHRAAIFREIYRGKRRSKTVTELMARTRLPRTRVLDAGKALADNEIIGQARNDGQTVYTKVEFFQRYRDRILGYATNPRARNAVPTKRNVTSKQQILRVSFDVAIPKRSVKARRVTVDDIESFQKVRKQPDDLDFVKMPETRFKRGVSKILGERGEFKDWGGELRDLSSTRLRIHGHRRAAALAFKGPGMTGRLVPGKLGKNGDQIQRLARCPADVFLVQYWAEIDDSVMEQLERFMQLKSFLENREVWYGIIDGQDSARLINAYPNQFK